MEESRDITVNAGDIARLADVGRAAVSNWRRRHEDFPQPVGGTASSPLFSLSEVAAWLRGNGKPFEVSLGDLVWQRIRTTADDLRLGGLVGRIGAFLLFLHREPGAWDEYGLRPPPGRDGHSGDDGHDGDGERAVLGGNGGRPLPGQPLPGRTLAERVAAATADLPGSAEPPPGDRALLRLVARLAAADGPLAAFEFLCERYAEAHSRQLAVTREDVAALMTRLVVPDGGTVLDPACGVGTLLLPAGTPIGQELSETNARLAAVRLLLRGTPARITAGDSLREDRLAGELADAVVCDPPFNERAWGYEELTGDPRWEYGLPPRGESELAWVQHCLAHVRPGGLVAILMPAAAAGRRPGKRIRGNLLRAGALRAVVSLAPGGPDLWLLRRPDGGRPPSRLLLVDAAEDLSAVEPAWRAYLEDPEAEPSGAGRTIRIIDLLDDEVDLTPARHRPQQGALDFARDFADALDRFRAASATLADAPPALEPPLERHDLPVTTIGELAKAGLVTVLTAPPRMASGTGPVPVLTAEDAAAGAPPSGGTVLDPALVMVRPGDVVATALGAVRVVAEPGAALGPQLTLYRVDPSRLDPHFLAGCLRSAGRSAHPGSSRLDVRRARVPMLPITEQRRYGAAFRELTALEDGLRETAARGETLIRLSFDGLVDGHLRPCDRGV
ncbi:SAM-dependent methyltransferase [Planomonospora parontospora subsp. parontospora]|uniref:SAM-dependent methyltransferase n=2 Tax=Planomonospora parontospora TaxID=58119 RepID=A0AA37F3D8_9ACTN|nr:N-6 DNA methylase [Planomonospora parontospora]GGK57103.1 SAM-dependent methyltransferase [Planomonospora parontospora]GII07730.1 SAM-dependent methyltransferase [Planomonospora parontospora subsp. parontospora]